MYEAVNIVSDLIAATAVLTVISCSVSLAGIALIIYVKGYRHFLYRLTLHLALASFVRAFSIGASVIPVDVARSNSTHVVSLPGTEGLCSLIGGFRQYAYLWCAVAIVWVCLYVIKKGCWVSRRPGHQGYEDIADPAGRRWASIIKRHKYEISGHIVSALLPMWVFWIPYTVDAYGLSGPWCWIHEDDDMHDSNGLLAFRIIFRLPAIVGSLVCVLLMCVIFCRYCRKGCLQNDQWQRTAVKRVAPVVIYPILFAMASVASILHPIVGRVLQYEKISKLEMLFLAIFFTYDMSITASLFLYQDIRVTLSTKCAAKCKRGVGIIRDIGMDEDDESKDLGT